ncbi:hypothetical protein GCM10010411_40330 [Actinomadura fulvescens]|uniref:Uncharacterized protein n=1 Tax=Actinomadura fulvescens TaxID=46160 RepID=A0ABP6C8K9_9ACTN
MALSDGRPDTAAYADQGVEEFRQASAQDIRDLINVLVTGPHTTFLAPQGPDTLDSRSIGIGR